MEEKMYLTVTLLTEVPDVDTARTLYEVVKTRLADHPEVTTSGRVSVQFDLDLP